MRWSPGVDERRTQSGPLRAAVDDTARSRRDHCTKGTPLNRFAVESDVDGVRVRLPDDVNHSVRAILIVANFDERRRGGRRESVHGAQTHIKGIAAYLARIVERITRLHKEDSLLTGDGVHEPQTHRRRVRRTRALTLIRLPNLQERTSAHVLALHQDVNFIHPLNVSDVGYGEDTRPRVRCLRLNGRFALWTVDAHGEQRRA